MPNLNDDQRRKFFDEGMALLQKRGMSPDQAQTKLVEDLAGIEGAKLLNPTSPLQSETNIVEEAGKVYPSMRGPIKAGERPYTERELRGAATMAGSLLPGGIIASAAGATAADLGFQTIRSMLGGQRVNPGESLGVGASNLVGGVAGKILTRAAGAVGGIPVEAQQVAGRSLNPFKKGEGFNLTFGRPTQEAELELGRAIQAAVQKIAQTTTAGRVAKVAIIKAAEKSGTMVSTTPVVDALRAQLIPDATEASAIAFNKKLGAFADRLAKRGNITPTQFDTMIIKEFDSKIFAGTGNPSLTMYGKALDRARDIAKETLESIHPSLPAANKASSMELLRREAADSVFGPSKLSLEARLRNLFKPGHEAEQQLLKSIGEAAGVNFYDDALGLSTKRFFTKDDRITAGVLNRVFLLTGTPQIARGITKVTAPVQRFVGPASAGVVGMMLPGNYGQAPRPTINPNEPFIIGGKE